MSRIRSVHPGLATDELFMSMSAYAKASWPLLWTECDDQGVFEWKPVVLKARLLPADNLDFEAILNELVGLGCVMPFEHDGKRYGAVRNFVRFQRPKNPKDIHPTPGPIRKWVGFCDDGTRPPAGTGRPSSASRSEVVPNTFPQSAEPKPQMKEEGGRRKDGTDEEIISDRQAVSAPARFEDALAHYTEAELAVIAVDYGEPPEPRIVELWRWALNKNAMNVLEAKRMVSGRMAKDAKARREAPELRRHMEHPPPVQVSAALASSPMARKHRSAA